MEINRKKLMYAILREVNNNSVIEYNAKTFGVDETLFTQVIKIIEEEKLISNIIVNDDLYRQCEILFRDDLPIISMKGIEFLNNNSPLAKTYKGLKEIRKWLPF